MPKDRSSRPRPEEGRGEGCESPGPQSRAAWIRCTLVLVVLAFPWTAPRAGAGDEVPDRTVEAGSETPSGAERMLQLSWFLPGQELRAEPDSGAPLTERLESLSLLPVGEERNGWLRVTYRGRCGWVDARGGPEPGDPRPEIEDAPGDAERGDRGSRGRAVDPLHRLARKILRLKKPRPFGGMSLYTDVERRPLLRLLRRAVEITPRAYGAGFVEPPSGGAGRAIVLFQDRLDYVSFLTEAGLPAAASSGGYAGSALVALWAGERSDFEITSVLIHELTHLVNRRALAPNLPPWLEEGLATDLGSFWVERNIDPPDGPVPSGWSERSRRSLRWLADRGEMPGIGALSELDSATFSHSPHTSLAYTHAGAFIRFLREHPVHGEAFLDFLRRIQAGYRGNMGLLLDSLDMDIESLDRAFRRWVQLEAKRSKHEH